MDGNYLNDIDYERENKIFQEGYQKGYYEAKWKTELEMTNFLCNLSDKALLEWKAINLSFMDDNNE